MTEEEQTHNENAFIEQLILNGGDIREAAAAAGFNEHYGYTLRRRLAKRIVEATHDYFAVHSIQAASRVVKSIDGEMPNSTQLTAALALLDRVGIIKKDTTLETLAAKANIFILPAKDDTKDKE